jgi:hypothetical protein
MGTIRKSIEVRTEAAEVWRAMRDYGAVHERVVPGFVVASTLEGRDRVITFISGAVARERLVSLDDDRRRLVYAVVDSGLGFEHHQSSVDVVDVVEPGGDRVDDRVGCRIVWTTDLLPDKLAETIDGLMSAGAAAMQRAFGA